MTATIETAEWTVATYPSQIRHNRIKVIASRGEGRNRQVINVELTPEAAAMFNPDQYWSNR